MNANEFLDKLKNVCNNECDCEHCVFFTDDSEKSMCRISNVLPDGIGVIDITPVERDSHLERVPLKSDSDAKINIKNMYVSIYSDVKGKLMD